MVAESDSANIFKIGQWRSSAPKSGGGHKLFSQKLKSEKQKKKKKKKGHSDRVLWIGEGLYSNALFIKLLGYVQSVFKLY